MTAVLGVYDPSNPLPEDDGTDAQYFEQQEDFDRPMDVYLHGNTAMMLRRGVVKNGSVKVCLTSTKGMLILRYSRSNHANSSGKWMAWY